MLRHAALFHRQHNQLQPSIVSHPPLPAGVVCGAAASGHYVWNDPEDIAQLLLCCMMSGPFLTGYTQTINDYYDREIDAINEPYRPIPSGGHMPAWERRGLGVHMQLQVVHGDHNAARYMQ